jgi:hypothetical protein
MTTLNKEGHDAKREQLHLRMQLKETKQEIEELQGLTLSELSNEEMHNLLVTQKQALEETERVFNLRLGLKAS